MELWVTITDFRSTSSFLTWAQPYLSSGTIGIRQEFFRATLSAISGDIVIYSFELSNP
jgi:hypothetical protein